MKDFQRLRLDVYRLATDSQLVAQLVELAASEPPYVGGNSFDV